MQYADPETLKILLVDDEPKIVNGLERNIGMMEADWEIEVAYSGAEGLEMLARESFDVIVSDLRMPEMNGAQFLEKAKVSAPATLRFILTGYADQDLMVRATGVAHRYLIKPCDSREVIDAIRQVYESRSLMLDSDIIRFVTETNELHINNQPLQDLLELTNDTDCDTDDVANMIESQPTVHASILHVSNSAFFGAGGQIETMREALHILGLEFVSSLASFELARREMNLPPHLHAMAGTVLKHCVETSQFALQMKPLIENPQFLSTLSSLSLLHDLGKLVFLMRQGDDYARLWKESAEQNVPLWKMEREAYGCDHAGIGAYLFALWGLPEALVQGVAWHHQPTKAMKDRLCPVSLLHMANYGAHKTREQSAYCSGELDAELAQRFSLSPDFHNELKRQSA